MFSINLTYMNIIEEVLSWVWWLTPVSLTTWEAEMGKITGQG
jgi:hypothetical protein